MVLGRVQLPLFRFQLVLVDSPAALLATLAHIHVVRRLSGALLMCWCGSLPRPYVCSLALPQQLLHTVWI